MSERHDLFRRAAHGDATAQLQLSQDALAMRSEPTVCLSLAEAFARMCACQDQPAGFRQLASVLLLEASYALSQGDRASACGRAGHALAIFDLLAEAGDDTAPAALEMFFAAARADGVQDDALAEAKKLKGVDLACA